MLKNKQNIISEITNEKILEQLNNLKFPKIKINLLK